MITNPIRDGMLKGGSDPINVIEGCSISASSVL